MLTSIVVSIVKTCTRFATPTLALGLILAIGSGVYTSRHFAINTDINTLISDRMDWRQRDQEFDKAFDRDATILAVVEAPTPDSVTLGLRDGRSVVWGGSGDSAAKARALGPLLTRPGSTYDVSTPTVAVVR